jgi:hypothetical protein
MTLNRKLTLVVSLLHLCACGSRSGIASASPSPQITLIATAGPRTIQQEVVGRATRCIVDGEAGPPSYLVRDIGKVGVPALRHSEAAMARSIAHYVKSRTLRFLIFPSGEFIVFDASDGPCETAAPGYDVLNEGCNAAYSPTDDFKSSGAFPDCNAPPRPWLKAKYGRRDSNR